MHNNITTLFSDTAAAIRERNYSTQIIAEEEIQDGQLYYTGNYDNKYANQSLGGSYIITYDNIKYLCETYGSIVFPGQPALGNETLWQKYNNNSAPSDDFHEENVPFHIICDTYTVENSNGYLMDMWYEWCFLCEDDKPHTIKVAKCVTPFENLVADDFPKLISEIPTGIKLPANQYPITITINWSTGSSLGGWGYESFICYGYKVDENNLIQSFVDEYELANQGNESGTIVYKIPPNTSLEFQLYAHGPHGASIDTYSASGYNYPSYYGGMEVQTIFFPRYKSDGTSYYSETLDVSFSILGYN